LFRENPGIISTHYNKFRRKSHPWFCASFRTIRGNPGYSLLKCWSRSMISMEWFQHPFWSLDPTSIQPGPSHNWMDWCGSFIWFHQTRHPIPMEWFHPLVPSNFGSIHPLHQVVPLSGCIIRIHPYFGSIKPLPICFTFWFHQTRSIQLVLIRAPDSSDQEFIMVLFCKSKNNGFACYEHPGINIKKTANKFLVFEIIQEGARTFSNIELKEHGKIFNWDRLPHVELYIVVELSTNSAMVYHATSSGKVS